MKMIKYILFGSLTLIITPTFSQQVFDLGEYSMTIPNEIKANLEYLKYEDPYERRMIEEKYIVAQKYFSEDDFVYIEIYIKKPTGRHNFHFDKNDYLIRHNLRVPRHVEQDTAKSLEINGATWTRMTQIMEFTSYAETDENKKTKTCYLTYGERAYNDDMTICMNLFETVKSQEHLDLMMSIMANIVVEKKSR